jgi:thiosulfate dehydrogenase [quinone] large subunit
LTEWLRFGGALKSNYKEMNYLLFRVVMGMNMVIHGAVRIFGDYQAFTTKMEKIFESTFIPNIFIIVGANLISPLEFIFGFMLILGFKTKESVFILTLNMMLLISGVCILQKWDLAGLQMSYVLYLFFIGNYIEYNNLSVDKLITNKRNKNE